MSVHDDLVQIKKPNSSRAWKEAPIVLLLPPPLGPCFSFRIQIVVDFCSDLLARVKRKDEAKGVQSPLDDGYRPHPCFKKFRSCHVPWYCEWDTFMYNDDRHAFIEMVMWLGHWCWLGDRPLGAVYFTMFYIWCRFFAHLSSRFIHLLCHCSIIAMLNKYIIITVELVGIVEKSVLSFV